MTLQLWFWQFTPSEVSKPLEREQLWELSFISVPPSTPQTIWLSHIYDLPVLPHIWHEIPDQVSAISGHPHAYPVQWAEEKGAQTARCSPARTHCSHDVCRTEGIAPKTHRSTFSACKVLNSKRINKSWPNSAYYSFSVKKEKKVRDREWCTYRMYTTIKLFLTALSRWHKTHTKYEVQLRFQIL